MCSAIGAHGEDAAGDLGVHGLDAAVEHLGKAGDVGDVLHGDAGFAEQLGGAAGRDQLGAQRASSARANSTMPVLSVTLMQDAR